MEKRKISFTAIRDYAERVFSTDRNNLSDLQTLEASALEASEHRRGGTYAMFIYSYRIEADALTEKVDNAVNLLAMACARSVFKKIDKVSADETTHQICVDFLGSLDKMDALVWAGQNAFTFRYDKDGEYERRTADGDAERILSSQDLYFHSLDVYSACRLAIYQLLDELGRAVNLEIVRPVRKQTREVIYGFDGIPEKITKDEMVTGITSIFRAGNNAVYENAAIKASNPKYIYIPLDEFKDDKERDARMFRRFNASAFIGGQSSLFDAGTAKNAELLEALFDEAEEKHGMTKTERRRTELKVNAPYLSWEQMARLEGVKSHNAVRKSVAKGLEKLGAVVPEGKARNAMYKYLTGLMEKEYEEMDDMETNEMMDAWKEMKKATRRLKSIRSRVKPSKCSWIDYTDEKGTMHHVCVEDGYIDYNYLNNKIDNVTDKTELRTFKMKHEHIGKDGLM